MRVAGGAKSFFGGLGQFCGAIQGGSEWFRVVQSGSEVFCPV